MYCDGQCKNLDEKKHKCNLTGEKLSYMRYGGRKTGFIVHEQNGVCAQDENKKEDSNNG